jgi:hypothetical protein
MATKRDRTLPLGEGFFMSSLFSINFCKRQHMTDDENFPTAQMKILEAARKSLAELELRMNYKAKEFSEQEQIEFDARFHNAIRMRKWVE